MTSSDTGRAVDAKSRPDRRTQLVDAAYQLIRDHGYEGFSVNELADQVGISVGGMYRYIRTKSDLLTMVCETLYGGLAEDLAAVAEEQPTGRGKLRAVLEHYFTFCDARRDRMLLMYREYRHLPPDAQRRYKERELAIVDVLRSLIELGESEGDFAVEDAEVAAYDLLLIGHLPALKNWALRRIRGSSEWIPSQVEFALNALRA